MHRGCSKLNVTKQECDPPNVSMESTVSFYCSFGCLLDGCNRHSVRDIYSSSNSMFTNVVLSSSYSLTLYWILLFFLLLFYE